MGDVIFKPGNFRDYSFRGLSISGKINFRENNFKICCFFFYLVFQKYLISKRSILIILITSDRVTFFEIFFEKYVHIPKKKMLIYLIRFKYPSKNCSILNICFLIIHGPHHESDKILTTYLKYNLHFLFCQLILYLLCHFFC